MRKPAYNCGEIALQVTVILQNSLSSDQLSYNTFLGVSSEMVKFPKILAFGNCNFSQLCKFHVAKKYACKYLYKK